MSSLGHGPRTRARSQIDRQPRGAAGLRPRLQSLRERAPEIVDQFGWIGPENLDQPFRSHEQCSIVGYQPSGRSVRSLRPFAKLPFNREQERRYLIDRPSVVIIGKSFAQRFFRSADPLGKQIENLGTTVTNKTGTIVGIVGDVVHGGPDHHPSPFDAFYPFSQQTERYGLLLVRAVEDPAGLTAGIRSALASTDPSVTLGAVQTYNELISKKYATRSLAVLLVSLFSTAALLLSAIGLYGILAYSVTNRARDIGIRAAIGADRGQILRMVVFEGFRLIGIGLLIGIGGALFVGQYMQSLLYGVSSADLLTLASAIIVLGVTGCLACLLPALRASKIDPVSVVRE